MSGIFAIQKTPIMKASWLTHGMFPKKNKKVAKKMNLKSKISNISDLMNEADFLGFSGTCLEWKEGQKVPYQSRSGDKKSMEVVRVYNSKDEMTGPFANTLVRLWSPNTKAALLAKCNMGEHYLIFANKSNELSGKIWLKPAQLKRVLSYEKTSKNV